MKCAVATTRRRRKVRKARKIRSVISVSYSKFAPRAVVFRFVLVCSVDSSSSDRIESNRPSVRPSVRPVVPTRRHRSTRLHQIQTAFLIVLCPFISLPCQITGRFVQRLQRTGGPRTVLIPERKPSVQTTLPRSQRRARMCEFDGVSDEQTVERRKDDDDDDDDHRRVSPADELCSELAASCFSFLMAVFCRWTQLLHHASEIGELLTEVLFSPCSMRMNERASDHPNGRIDGDEHPHEVWHLLRARRRSAFLPARPPARPPALLALFTNIPRSISSMRRELEAKEKEKHP